MLDSRLKALNRKNILRRGAINMKAIKRTVSVLLSLMLVLGMVTMGISVASAAENTITYTSNIGAQGTKTYVPGTDKQVTVTYNLKTSTPIINVQAVVTFDPAVLKLADGQTAATVCPNIPGATVNLTKSGRVPFAASDFAGGYDFSAGGAFVTVIFDIIGSGNTTVNLAVDTLTGTTALNTSSANDVPVVIAEELQEGAAITPTAEAEVSGESGNVDPSVFLYQYMGNFEGKVGLIHFFYKNPQGYDPSKLTIKFSGSLDDYNVTMKYTDMTSAAAKIYRFDYFTYSTMFAQDITFEIYEGNTLLTKKSYSIEKYILDKLPNSNTNQANFYKAALNYGGYAQVKFNKYTDSLANRGIDSNLTAVNANSITLPAGVGEEPDLTDIGITKLYSEQGEYLDDTRIRLFYQVSDASNLGAATIVGPTGTSVTANFSKVNNKIQQLIIPNIGSAYLDEVQTVTFRNNKTYKTTMMSRVKKQLADTTISEADRNFFTALYWYNYTANIFFNK